MVMVMVMAMVRLVGSSRGSRMGFKEGGWVVVRFRSMRIKHIYRLGTRLVTIKSYICCRRDNPMFCFLLMGLEVTF